MCTDLFEPLQVLSQLRAKIVRKRLHILASFPFTLPIQEPFRDFELLGRLNDCHEFLHLVLGQLTRPVRFLHRRMDVGGKYKIKI